MNQMGIPADKIVEMAKDNGDYLGTVLVEGNIALNEGLQLIGDLMIGSGTPTKWDTSNAYIGVGDSNTAENATQTALQAATNYAYRPMDSTFPSRSGQTLSWKSTFAAGTGSFSWKEVTVINGNGTGTNLNRKVGDWGTKGASDSYSMQVNITLS